MYFLHLLQLLFLVQLPYAALSFPVLNAKTDLADSSTLIGSDQLSAYSQGKDDTFYLAKRVLQLHETIPIKPQGTGPRTTSSSSSSDTESTISGPKSGPGTNPRKRPAPDDDESSSEDAPSPKRPKTNQGGADSNVAGCRKGIYPECNTCKSRTDRRFLYECGASVCLSCVEDDLDAVEWHDNDNEFNKCEHCRAAGPTRETVNSHKANWAKEDRQTNGMDDSPQQTQQQPQDPNAAARAPQNQLPVQRTNSATF